MRKFGEIALLDAVTSRGDQRNSSAAMLYEVDAASESRCTVRSVPLPFGSDGPSFP